MKAIVVGAGIAGIASAIRLRLLGMQVHVYEGNAYAGGKLSSFQQGPYRFDAGPSLFTLPELVDELFTLAGEDPSQHFSYHKLKEVCHYFYEDGTRLTAFADSQKFAKEMEEKLQVPADKVLRYLQKSKQKYELTKPIFIDNSLHKLSTYTNRLAFKALRNLHKIGIVGSMHQHNEKYLQNKKLVQLFDRYATYNGSSPYKAPATLSLIPHLEQGIGAFLPHKGMVAITDALVELAKRKGVQFHFSTKVEQIVVENAQVIGVKVQGQLQQAQVVVCNMDVSHAYPSLLPQLKAPKKVLAQEKSSSALIFYWGIKGTFPELGVHNIFFSDDYEKEFEHLFALKTLYSDPTVYINCTSKLCPEDAPPGAENWFVMINTPANYGQDWDKFTEKSRERILNKLSRLLKKDIASLIENESVLSPISIEERTYSHRGSLYGSSSNNKFAAFLRHKNFSSQCAGLYFCGGSVHPGGGIPLCLSSAKIVGKLVAKKYKLA